MTGAGSETVKIAFILSRDWMSWTVSVFIFTVLGQGGTAQI